MTGRGRAASEGRAGTERARGVLEDEGSFHCRGRRNRRRWRTGCKYVNEM